MRTRSSGGRGRAPAIAMPCFGFLLQVVACVWPLVTVWHTFGDAFRISRQVRRWQGHRDGVLDLAVPRDGGCLVTGSDDHAAMAFQL